jgi:hypothetical protein
MVLLAWVSGLGATPVTATRLLSQEVSRGFLDRWDRSLLSTVHRAQRCVMFVRLATRSEIRIGSDAESRC